MSSFSSSPFPHSALCFALGLKSEGASTPGRYPCWISSRTCNFCCRTYSRFWLVVSSLRARLSLLRLFLDSYSLEQPFSPSCSIKFRLSELPLTPQPDQPRRSSLGCTSRLSRAISHITHPLSPSLGAVDVDEFNRIHTPPALHTSCLPYVLCHLSSYRLITRQNGHILLRMLIDRYLVPWPSSCMSYCPFSPPT